MGHFTSAEPSTGKQENKMGTASKSILALDYSAAILRSALLSRALTVTIVSLLLWAGSVLGGPSQIVTLNPGDSINLSQLVGANGLAVQVGDKLFNDFSFQFSDTDPDLGNDLQPTAIAVTALSNPIGYGISFSGPLTAVGAIEKDLVIRFSVAVTDPQKLISDVHLSYNGAAQGSGFSSVTEEVFTDGFGGQKIAQLEVLNPGDPNPVFQDVAVLLLPREKLYLQKDIIFGGGGIGDQNRAWLSIIDESFSQVPEPSTLALSVAGLAALLYVKRRK